MKPRNPKDKLPALTGKEILAALQRAGGELDKYEGSHARIIFNGNLVIVPIHSKKTLPEGTLKSIIKQTGLTKKQFKNLFSVGFFSLILSKISMLFMK